MERLLADATALSGVKYDINNLADVYEAIHVVQTELGITGTTAKEASETISGSLASMKSAWQNLVVGVADDNADFDKLVANFVDSAGTAAKNILPRISTALSGVGKLIEGLAPVITQAIPTIVSDVLPGLLSAAQTLISTFLSAILENLPAVLDAAIEFVTTIGDGIAENAPMLIDATLEIIGVLADGLIENLPGLFTAITDIILVIVDRLTQPEMIEQLINGALGIILALVTGIVQNLPRIIQAATQIIRSLVEYFKTHWDDIKAVGKQILDMVVTGIQNTLIALWDLGGEIVDAIGAGISAAWDGLVGWFNNLWDGLFGGRSVDVDVNGNANVEGSHAIGLDYVPFNGYLAELHRGEAVLTSREASEWRRGNGSQRQESNQPITIVVQSMLDGKVVGESVTRYQRNMARAMG